MPKSFKDKKSTRSARPDAEAIRAMLFEGHFGTSDYAQDALAMGDPVTVTQLVLQLSEIKAYDKNPRQLANPKYQEIKASILSQRGLNNHFNVTRRPGDTCYMIQAGGNTRLAILRELYAETGDAAFNSVHCLFIPWTSESSALTAHLVENELRGEMAMIDKAYAVAGLRNELEHEQGISLSDRAFIKALQDLGYKLSHRQLRSLNYARLLDALIPQALRAGITYRQLDHIKQTEKVYQHYCADKTAQGSAIFASNMAAYDSDTFDFAQVREAIDVELAMLFSMPRQRLTLHIDALLFDGAAKPELDDLLEDTEPAYLEQATTAFEASPPSVQLAQLGEREINNAARQQASNSPPKVSTAVASPGNDLFALQHQGFKLACQLACYADIAHLVLPMQWGMGFVMDPTTLLSKNTSAYAIWSLLQGMAQAPILGSVALSETNAPKQCPHEDRQGLNPIDNADTARDGPLCSYHVLNDPGILVDSAFDTAVSLLKHCRLLRQLFAAAQLWPET